jgi:predicted transcriptional regulator
MGVVEDINWLNEDKDGARKVFQIVAAEGNAGLRKIKASHGSNNWWPVKACVKLLIERGLVAESEGNYRLTDPGKKVSEGIRTMDGI